MLVFFAPVRFVSLALKRTGRFALFCLLLLPETLAAGEPGQAALRWHLLPPLPDPIGFAGPFAGVSGDALVVAGGANFPDQPPWQGGKKQWHDTIFVLDEPNGTWKTAGKLPRPLAYGVSLTTRDGVVCAGGGDALRHEKYAFLLHWEDGHVRTSPLPDLPRPCAFLSGALLGDTVYLAGGIETPDTTTALKTFWALDLSRAPRHWQELEPWPGPERMLAVTAAQDGAFFLISGTRLKPGADGQAVREYLSDAYRYLPGQGWTRIADAPCPVVAAPSPAPTLGRTELLVLGGDDGSHVDFKPLDQHPGFSRRILAYDTRADAWTARGELPFSLVTVPQVPWRGYVVVPGGECRPGTRSPQVWSGEPPRAAIRFGALDLLTLGGALLALAGIGTNILQRRKKPALASPVGAAGILLRDHRRTGAYAWILVGLLWVVAVLNYLDRQVIFSVFPLLQADLHLSNVQLGLLGTVFFWVYAVLSPVSGFLADRYGRKRVIVLSLLVWSVVTWLTGQARNVPELLGARALMGVSEACYLPAALALIAGYHGERTRSLATGLHQSGLYVGIVLGGVGGAWLGERYGWRWAFALLGAVGVLYLLVLVLTLREGEAAAEEQPAAVRLGFGRSLRELFALSGFGKLVLVFSAVAVANLMVYTWLPLYLYERFRMNLTAAGFSATFYIQAASLGGILLGGWLADRWSTVTTRGRLWTQAVGLLIAAPCLSLVGVAGSQILLIGGLVLFGLGRGFYDCNTMPVLCQIARADLRATGYGVFNFAGCLTGGGIAVLAGALKDAVGLGSVFQLAGLLLLLSMVLLWRIPVRSPAPAFPVKEQDGSEHF